MIDYACIYVQYNVHLFNCTPHACVDTSTVYTSCFFCASHVRSDTIDVPQAQVHTRLLCHSLCAKAKIVLCICTFVLGRSFHMYTSPYFSFCVCHYTLSYDLHVALLFSSISSHKSHFRFFPFLSEFKQCSSYSSIVCIALVNVAHCSKIIRHSEIKRFFLYSHSPSRLLLSFCCTFSPLHC